MNKQYALGLIYSVTGDKIGLFEHEGALWPCLVYMKKPIYIADRFKQATDELFAMSIVWQNIKPVELDIPSLNGMFNCQVFRTFQPGLIYACPVIRAIADYDNRYLTQLVNECNKPTLLPYKNVIINQ